MANISYIRFLSAIEYFCKEHRQIRRFASDFPGQLPNFATKTEEYPILFVSPSDSIFNENTTTFNVDIYCFDIIQKDRSNINTILSDTNLILSDLNRWILDGEVDIFDILNSPTSTPLNNELLDYCAGWRMTLTIDCPTYGVCEIPFIQIPSITNEVNNVVYNDILTCENLADCDTFTDAIGNLQLQIDNIELTPGPTGATGAQGATGPANPIVSGYFLPDNNTLTLVDSLGGEVVINNEINIIEKSLAEIQDKISNNALVRGVTYKISDVDVNLYSAGTSGEGNIIYLLALENNKLDIFGTGLFFVPNYKDYSIWNSYTTYYSGDAVIWGGYIWINKSDNSGSPIDDYQLDENWSLEKFEDGKYYSIVYDKIKYDIVNDKIVYRNERNINEVSFSYADLDTFNTSDYCPISAFQWGRGYSFDKGIGRYIGIGNQKIYNSLNRNINYDGLSQDNIIMTNHSSMYNQTFNGGNVFMSYIQLHNSSKITNLTFNGSATIEHIRLDNNSYIDDLSLENSGLYENIPILSKLELNNTSYLSLITIISGRLNEYTLNNNSYIESCDFINSTNFSMLYDNNASQLGTNNFDGVKYYFQRKTTIKNTQITIVDKDQDGWFFLGDLPNSTTTDIVGRVGNQLVDVTGGASSQNLDDVLTIGNTSAQSINIQSGTLSTVISPDLVRIGNPAFNYADYRQSGIRFFRNGAFSNIISNPLQTSLFEPIFQLPQKATNATLTLATTEDYTLNAVLTAGNSTTLNAVFISATKSCTINGSSIQLTQTGSGSSTTRIENDRITWSRFGNNITLSALDASGSNSANYIFPTKNFGTYSLATTVDLYTVSSLNTNNLFINLTGSGTTVNRGFNVRGITSSNQTISIVGTGSNTNTNWAWDVRTNPNLVVDSLQFNTASTSVGAVGRFVWNDNDGTADLTLKGGNVTLQVGQENVLRVVNKTATSIDLLQSNYQAVRITGAQGNRLKVDLAQATTDSLSAETIGLVTETILNNAEGFITTSGLVRNIDTTGTLQGQTWNDGDMLYLSPTTAGQITNVKPSAPNHLIVIGYVVRAHATQGAIFVKVDNGYELDELHNVKITGTPSNNQILSYSSSLDLWENKGLTAALGYTPYDATNPVGYVTASIVNNYGLIRSDLQLRNGGYTIWEEFYTAVSNVFSSPFVKNVFSSATIAMNTAVTTNNPGVLNVSSSTTANSGCAILLNNNSTICPYYIMPSQQFDCILRLPSTINALTTIRFGIIGNNTSADATNGVYFEIVSNGVVAKTAAASTRSSSSSFTLSALTFYHFRIVVNSLSLITYTIFDMSGAILFTTTLNTNIPTQTAQIQPGLVATNSGTTAVQLLGIDYISFYQPPLQRGALT